MTLEEEIKELNFKRGQIKARLTRISKFLTNFKDGQDINQVKARLSIVRDAFNDFDKIQSLIEQKADNPETDAKEREEFETAYFSAVVKIESLIERSQKPRQESNATSSSQSNSSPNTQTNNVPENRIKLPTLDLPEFSGSYSDWLSFRDVFNSLINDNSNLSSIEKMHYLRSSVKGEALRTIESLAVSNSNYATAWSLLQRRYENTRLIVQAHIRNIINSPILTKGSYANLRQLIDDITINLESIKVLKIETDTWDPILVPIITDKLDFQSNKEWQAKLTSKLPTLEELMIFLETRCNYLESITPNNSAKQKSFPKNGPLRVMHSTTKRNSCVICKGNNHSINQCKEFLKLNVTNRIKRVKQLNLCLNCLRNNHLVAECKSNSTCRECNARHNSLLHADTADMCPDQSIEIAAKSSDNHCCNYSTSHPETLLSTAVIYIKGHDGKYHDCRALIDSGSQSNFITRALFDKLNLKSTKVTHHIQGINECVSKITESVEVNIKSKYNNYSTTIHCLILTKITEPLPLVSFPTDGLEIPSNINLADPQFNISKPIDLLIGVQLFWELLKVGKIQLGPNKIFIQNTHFGWIIGGGLNFTDNRKLQTYYSSNLSVNSSEFQTLNKQVAKFWELEGYEQPAIKTFTKDEQQCEQHFIETTKRDPKGRFIVQLPTKGNKISLGNSEIMAKKRFFKLEQKLDKDPNLKHDYCQFMNEYERLGHMSLLKTTNPDQTNVFYLPHHAVLKQSSLTTKLRVVFDASAKSTNGLSLNDNLLTGPTMQQDLLSILTRFRTYQYVLSADIVKIYRQILVDPRQVNYQRIFWRNSHDEPVKVYHLNTVTYGTTSASFLAVRCLIQLAHEFQQTHPHTSNVILRDFYMDDVLTGGNSIEETLKIKEQLPEILKSGGFELNKWASNSTKLLLESKEQSHTTNIINLDKNGETKTLGLLWNCVDDTLRYKVQTFNRPKILSKRVILSIVSTIFDPLGLISPIIIRAKVLLQQLWSRSLGWDQEIPCDVQISWNQLMQDFISLNIVQIPRKVLLPRSTRIELHGFADASVKAYGAVIYLRTINDKDTIQTELLLSKSRVAPLKVVTIPRLELLAAQLLAQLVNQTKNILNLKIDQTFLWTDSSIVLAWLAKPSNQWQCFVANRVANIQNLTNIDDWSHVSTTDNPADLISRGASTQQLTKSPLWWHGPPWLSSPAENWPKTNVAMLNERVEIPEKRKVTVVNVALINDEFFRRFSNFNRLRYCIAYCLRFVHNCKYAKAKRTDFISSQELNEANIQIIKWVQQQSFSKELADLTTGKQIGNDSTLLSLDVFLDQNGLIRVGGRLKYSNISYDKKHPIVLPKRHRVTTLIIECFHVKHLHAGAQATLTAIRENYWIVAGRSTVRKVLHKCTKCFKASPKFIQQKMGELPLVRLQPARPFLNCGVDYCGPINIKENLGRGKKTMKAYIALFVCLCTRAIHIELVGNLTTEYFLNALRRIISRRGSIKHFYSDNGTNFVGAKRQLTELHDFFDDQNFKQHVITKLNNENITWSFIPPKSPNFGGIWEAGVKSVKYHLKRTIGETLLTYEEMYTLLTRIEACLNSRPLTPLSNDPNDLNVLTSGHFLIGEPLTAPLEIDITEIKVNRLSRWQLLEKMRQHFWKRWQREYISQLQGRCKWKTTASEVLRPGVMVLIKEDNAPPLHWPLGRIVDIHPGKDSVIRVVSIKTNNGVWKRPVSKVCVLPIDN